MEDFGRPEGICPTVGVVQEQERFLARKNKDLLTLKPILVGLRWGRVAENAHGQPHGQVNGAKQKHNP